MRGAPRGEHELGERRLRGGSGGGRVAILLSGQSRPRDEGANGAREQVALTAHASRAALGRDHRRAPSVRNHVHGALAHDGRVAQVRGKLGRVLGQRVRRGNFATLGVCSAQ